MRAVSYEIKQNDKQVEKPKWSRFMRYSMAASYVFWKGWEGIKARVRGSPIEGRLGDAPLSPRFLGTPWKKRMFQFAGASRAFTVSFTTLRGEHIVSLSKYDTVNNVANATFKYNNSINRSFYPEMLEIGRKIRQGSLDVSLILWYIFSG